MSAATDSAKPEIPPLSPEPARWESPIPGEIRIGSAEHKQLFCRMLLDTFDPYRPAAIDWPKLNDDALHRLTSLPFWDIAVRTEGYAASRVKALAEATDDPLLKEAVALNAFEEQRHKDVLANMVAFYGIQLGPEPVYPRVTDPEWAFLRTGYGECFDSFFAFGLFKMARDSGFFPSELVEVFEPVIREEARHILFFVNWVAWTRAQKGLIPRPAFDIRRVYALLMQAWGRVRTAGDIDGDNFTSKGHEALSGDNMTPGRFMDLCLAENKRRLGYYDRRLLQPVAMPRLVRALRRFMK